MKKNVLVLVASLISFLVLTSAGHACVGRELTVATSDSPDQLIIGQMLAVLITERTGTTVNIVELGNVEQCEESVRKGDAQLYISYVDIAWASTGHAGKVGDSRRTYTLVSQFYLDTFDMVWLRPFGFRGPLTAEESGNKRHGSLAAPITTTDVLKKFPVLDRVINKLAGRIDNETIEELRRKTEKQPVEEVVRTFLKNQKLI
jgi:osmoprotectant transport system substrate-binding protein